MINETGRAVTGRRQDFSAMLAQLAPTARSTTTTLDQLITDNHTLTDLVATTDRFIARVDAQEVDLNHLIGNAAGAVQTFAQRSGSLRRSLSQAPSALLALQGFLGQLRTTSIALDPAARTVTAAAPWLARVLAHLPAFETAARPTLQTALTAASPLTTLATQATPTITRATPTVASLSTT
jgi:ABC-type transporter Mla subunit MlaD